MSATLTDISAIRINGERLWSSLMQLAQIGATAKGGVCREPISVYPQHEARGIHSAGRPRQAFNAPQELTPAFRSAISSPQSWSQTPAA